MRIGILGLLQESNTFVPGRTTLEHFQQDLLLEGNEILQQLSGAHHEIGGFLEGLEHAQLEAVPLLVARALPHGIVARETLEELVARMLQRLRSAGPLDGVLVAPHGATVAEHERDADGYWLGRVRQEVGPNVPLIGTLDPHANLSERMVRATDALIAYRTNPHLDQRARGVEAAQLLARTVRHEVRPTQAAIFPPMAINIEAQHTDEPPCRWLVELTDEIRHRPGVLSASLLLGFPYADVAEMGSAALVVTDGSPEAALCQAQELAARMWQLREPLRGTLLSIEQVIARLQQQPALRGPVCLLDMGDNIGGGSPGDGTTLLHALRDAPVAGVLACLWDPAGVQAAEQVGIGGTFERPLGGQHDPRLGAPLGGKWTVVSLHEGLFHETEPRHGGFQHFDQGRSAVVRGPGDMTLLVTSRRMVPFSLQQLISCGLDPRGFRVVIAKGVHAPAAAYRSICPELLRVDTPGSTTADLSRLAYQYRRRPMFPLEPDTTWQPAASEGVSP